MGFKTIINVAATGDLNGKSKAQAADATAKQLRSEMLAYETLGYRQASNIVVSYKAVAVGMRWIATVKMEK